jgi:hypothetical protein
MAARTMSSRFLASSTSVTCKHCGKSFRAITVRHLRNIHGYEGDHPIMDYKRRFGLDSTMCGEVRSRISETKDEFWARKGQHWTPEKVLAEIRQRHDADQSLRERSVPPRLTLAARRYFGSWRAAIEKAGFDYEEVTGWIEWTRWRIMARIRELDAEGSPLHASFICEHYPTLFHAAVKQFPRSWQQALVAAGIDRCKRRMPDAVREVEQAKCG